MNKLTAFNRELLTLGKAIRALNVGESITVSVDIKDDIEGRKVMQKAHVIAEKANINVSTEKFHGINTRTNKLKLFFVVTKLAGKRIYNAM